MSVKKKTKKNSTEASNFILPKSPTKTAAKYDEDLPKKVETKQDIKEKSWYLFVLSFLGVAINNCEFILNGRLTNNDKILVIGIIFNFKHSLEVVIKAFSRVLSENMDKSDRGHDTKALLEAFKKKPKIKNKRKLSQDINELEKLIEKYNELNFFKSYLKESFSIYDQENTFFKYPEHSARIVVDYSDFLNKISRNDIIEIKKVED